MIYFDNAATTYPKPRSVESSMVQALNLFGANPGRSGHDMSIKTAEQIFACREAAAQMFNAQITNVIFTQNCTQSVNTVIKGLLKPGDHVIISNLEHNAVLRPVHALSKTRDIHYSIARPNQGESYAECFAREIRPNTRLIVATHGSNVFGTMLPIREIGELAHSKNIQFMVDGAQSAGVQDIDMKKDNINYLCMPGHKGLYGPPGTGLLIVNDAAPLEPLIQGGTGSLSLQYDQPDFLPDQLESGTLNTTGIIALHSGINFVKRSGIGKLRAHEQKIITIIYDRLAKMPEIQLYTPRPERNAYLPLLSFNIKGISGEQTSEKLNRYGIATRGGYHCSPLAHETYNTLDTGTCRVSVGAFNTEAQAEEMVYYLKKIINSL